MDFPQQVEGMAEVGADMVLVLVLVEGGGLVGVEGWLDGGVGGVWCVVVLKCCGLECGGFDSI